MSLNATLQIYDHPGAGGLNAAQKVAKALKDVYTVLKLDYTFERKCDPATGRPNHTLSIDKIKVTIRGAKESKATFHQWIATDNKLMDGEIKIFDSSGLFSSSLQDATGIAPLLDSEEIPDLLMDMTGEAMGTAMDDASDYDIRDFDMYDELSHAQLLKQARERGIVVNSQDTDDDIREMFRQYDDLDESDIKKATVGGDEKTIDDMTLDDLKAYAKENHIDAPEDKSKAMKRAELDAYVKNNNLEVDANASDEDVRKKVKEDMDKKAYKKLVINRERGNKAREKQKQKHLEDKSFNPAYKKADELKKRTVSSLQGLGTAAVKRNFECGRCITFESAFCISLKETYASNPASVGKLDQKYPWVLEIGIKPKKVTVTGEQLAGQNITLGQANVTAVFDDLYN